MAAVRTATMACERRSPPSIPGAGRSSVGSTHRESPGTSHDVAQFTHSVRPKHAEPAGSIAPLGAALRLVPGLWAERDLSAGECGLHGSGGSMPAVGRTARGVRAVVVPGRRLAAVLHLHPPALARRARRGVGATRVVGPQGARARGGISMYDLLLAEQPDEPLAPGGGRFASSSISLAARCASRSS